MSAYLNVELRRELLQADGRGCAYCQTTESNSGQPMVIDHIIPESRGGKTQFDNLCFSCRRCNEFKGATVQAIDPLTGETTPLFHPRRHRWHDHFDWDLFGARIIGLTAVGRATIVALNMNNPVITNARRRWISVGWHPPGR